MGTDVVGEPETDPDNEHVQNLVNLVSDLSLSIEHTLSEGVLFLFSGNIKNRIGALRSTEVHDGHGPPPVALGRFTPWAVSESPGQPVQRNA